jgi:tRNA dimethylallyltransferase
LAADSQYSSDKCDAQSAKGVSALDVFRSGKVLLIKPLQIKPAPMLVVLGPTGTGKSELALNLAEAFGGEIVNCDSIQVYRGLQIGSAKVPVEARRGIPHHLIDILSLDEQLTAGAYARLARAVFQGLGADGKLPIVVGGTGFYLKALLDGLSPAPGRDERLRARLGEIAARRPLALHRFLRVRDPQGARRIHPHDRQKLIRAIELTLLAGSATKTQSLPRDSLRGFNILKLGLAPQRTLLYERLNERSAHMFQNGLLAETKALLDAGVLPSAKPLQSLGYKQAVNVITNHTDFREAIQECQTKTRQYAKRQLTWFRREPDINWLTGFGGEKRIQQEALEITGKFFRESSNRTVARE